MTDDVWSQLDTQGAAPPASSGDIWSSLDHPSSAAPPAEKAPPAQIPDWFEPGTNPQDRLAAWNRHQNPNAMDVLADKVIGGTVRGIKAGYRGIASLASGEGLDTAAAKVNETASEGALQPTGGSGKAAAAVMDSPWNPLNYVDEAGQWLGDKSADLGFHPAVSTALRILPDAYAAWRGARTGESGPATGVEPEVVERGPHPLAAAAEAETNRISAVQERGKTLGLNLPEGATKAQMDAASATNTPIANDVVRKQLGLPEGAPLTTGMLEKARARYGSPTYRAIASEPEFDLNDTYKDAIGNVDTSLIPEKYRPPSDGTMTGERAVELSRYLRNRANKYYAAAKGNPQLEDIADAHWDAAEAVEDAVKDHLADSGREKLAQNWDNARTYIAQTYSVQRALDGAGNVKVSDLRSQFMKNKPLGGDLGTLAELAARYPEAFKTVRETAPKTGLMRRAAAAAIPTLTTGAGAAGGAVLGLPGAAVGGAIGRAAGENLSNKIMGGQ